MAGYLERGRRRLKRFWLHRQSNIEIARLGEWVARYAPQPDGQPVVFFNASTRLSGMSLNAAYALLSSWAVRLSGTRVVHFVCDQGMSRCVLGTRRSDPHQLPPCRECTRQSDALFSGAEVRQFQFHQNPVIDEALGGMNLEQLKTAEIEGVPLGRLVLPSVRWVLRRHLMENDEPTLFLFRSFLASAWNIVQEIQHLFDEVNPQAMVVFNGISYPEAVARWAAEQRGMRVVTHEVCHQPFSAFFSTRDATAYAIQVPDEFELSSDQNQRLDAYLEQRFQGNFSMAGIRFWPEMRSLSAEFLELAGRFKQLVPIFTNVIFDTSQSHSNVLFEHMFAWLELVLGVIRAHPETLFVIRAHPDESRPGKESQESVADWVEKNGVDHLLNVLFVPSQEYFSSYELIQRSKFVLLYNSTIGLEAALMGAPVLCAGRARFTQLPMVFFPESQEAYQRTLEDFLAADRVSVPAEFVRNARRFLYYNLYRACLPFDEFIEPDGIWAGYARLKEFDLQTLLPGRAAVLQVIVDGIVSGKPFLMPEEEA